MTRPPVHSPHLGLVFFLFLAHRCPPPQGRLPSPLYCISSLFLSIPFVPSAYSSLSLPGSRHIKTTYLFPSPPCSPPPRPRLRYQINSINHQSPPLFVSCSSSPSFVAFSPFCVSRFAQRSFTYRHIQLRYQHLELLVRSSVHSLIRWACLRPRLLMNHMAK